MMSLMVNYALNNLGTIETCCQMQSTSSHVLFDVEFSSQTRLMAIDSSTNSTYILC